MRDVRPDEDDPLTHCPHLSEQWVEAVRRVRADHVGGATDRIGLTVNATITRVPFGAGTADALLSRPRHQEVAIELDLDAFRDWWHSRVGDAETAGLDRQVRAITACPRDDRHR